MDYYINVQPYFNTSKKPTPSIRALKLSKREHISDSGEDLHSRAILRQSAAAKVASNGFLVIHSPAICQSKLNRSRLRYTDVRTSLNNYAYSNTRTQGGELSKTEAHAI
jgi:hypothetical protein